MRTRFDHLGKQIGRQALRAFGPTAVQDEILPEVQYADLRHEPDPARATERRALGLLDRLTARPCILELYGHAPGAAEIRTCLLKHFASWQHQARKLRSDGQRRATFVEPTLWIIAAGTPRAVVAKLRLEPARGWPRGVYHFGADALRVGLVAANQLPRVRSTLLVRLMAAGPLLPRAVAELSALPRDAHERIVADPILLSLQHALERKSNRTPKEQEFIVIMEKSWERARELGMEEGDVKARARNLLTVLRVRGIRVPAVERDRIRAEKDPDRLERWLERAVVETSLAAVLEDRAGARTRTKLGSRPRARPTARRTRRTPSSRQAAAARRRASR